MKAGVYYTGRCSRNTKIPFAWSSRSDVETPSIEPAILPRAQHPISRRLINENALKVLHRLKDAGYASLLVGGCVRDLMLGREPKDFDLVTDARPEEIRKLFHNARLIGRRFRLAHVRYGRDVLEVATFRALPRDAGGDGDAEEDAQPGMLKNEGGRLLRDNVFGNQAEDAIRRDFTVNALYYNIRDLSVMDYVGGVADLQAGVIRVIGNPETRYREDPVRMLRAIRFAAKLGFRLEEKTAAPIPALAPLLADVPPARLFEEVLKLFHGGYAAETYELLRQHGLFRYLFPATEDYLSNPPDGLPSMLVPRALANTDARVNEGKPVTPAFLFAAMLWEPARQRMQADLGRGRPHAEALTRAADAVLAEQLKHVSIPRRFSVPMREIWDMQQRLEYRAGSRAFRLLEHPRFRAAYDFLLLCADTGGADAALAQWWTEFQELDEQGRQQKAAALAPASGTGTSRGKRRRRGGRGGRRPGTPTPVLG
jgi:poly(A) polymerase